MNTAFIKLQDLFGNVNVIEVCQSKCGNLFAQMMRMVRKELVSSGIMRMRMKKRRMKRAQRVEKLACLI